MMNWRKIDQELAQYDIPIMRCRTNPMTKSRRPDVTILSCGLENADVSSAGRGTVARDEKKPDFSRNG